MKLIPVFRAKPCWAILALILCTMFVEGLDNGKNPLRIPNKFGTGAGSSVLSGKEESDQNRRWETLSSHNDTSNDNDVNTAHGGDQNRGDKFTAKTVLASDEDRLTTKPETTTVHAEKSVTNTTEIPDSSDLQNRPSVPSGFLPVEYIRDEDNKTTKRNARPPTSTNIPEVHHDSSGDPNQFAMIAHKDGSIATTESIPETDSSRVSQDKEWTTTKPDNNQYNHNDSKQDGFSEDEEGPGLNSLFDKHVEEFAQGLTDVLVGGADKDTTDLSKSLLHTECFSDQQAQLNGTLEMCPISMVMTRDVICGFQEDSCQNRCDQNDFEAGCSCLPICKLYKTCCGDYDAHCSTSNQNLTIFREDLIKDKIVCNNLMKARLISGCPDDFTNNDKLVKECERPEILSAAAIMPVTDSSTGHQFKNMACWKCWGMPGVGLYWSAKFYYDISVKPDDDHGYNLTTYFSPIAKSRHRGKWIPPAGHEKQVCDDCVVSSCTGCRHPILESKCASQLAMVTLYNVTYRNENCYLCSKKKMSMIDHKQHECGFPRRDTFSESNYYLKDNAYDTIVVKLSVSGQNLLLFQDLSSKTDKFAWLELQCGLGAEDCIAKSCNYPRILVNGSCQNDLRSLVGQIKVCVGYGRSNSDNCKRPSEKIGSRNASVSTMMKQIASQFKNYSLPTLGEETWPFYDGGSSLSFMFTANYPLDTEGQSVCYENPVRAVLDILYVQHQVQEVTRVCSACFLGNKKSSRSVTSDDPDLSCRTLNMSDIAYHLWAGNSDTNSACFWWRWWYAPLMAAMATACVVM